MTSNSRTGLIYWSSLSGLTGQSSDFDIDFFLIQIQRRWIPASAGMTIKSSTPLGSGSEAGMLEEASGRRGEEAKDQNQTQVKEQDYEHLMDLN